MSLFTDLLELLGLGGISGLDVVFAGMAIAGTLLFIIYFGLVLIGGGSLVSRHTNNVMVRLDITKRVLELWLIGLHNSEEPAGSEIQRGDRTACREREARS